MTPDSPGLNQLHVSRDGALLGAYHVDQIADLLERGQLLPTDQFYDESRAEWIALSDWKEPDRRTEFRTAEERPAESSGRRGSRQGHRSRRPHGKNAAPPSLSGWIACLLGLGAAAGIWAWAENLRTELVASKQTIAQLREQVASLQKLEQFGSELVPPGHIRGVVTYEPARGQIAIMSGTMIGIYSAEAAAQALQAAFGSDQFVATPETFGDSIERLKAQLKSPIEVTLSGSNGRFDLALPPAEYVLVAFASSANGPDLRRYVWMVKVRSTEQPSQLIILTSNNAASPANPTFEIREATRIP